MPLPSPHLRRPLPESLRPAGQVPGLRRLLAALTLFAGCLCPPSNEALLDVGFRSPEQTVRTFQTGVRADQFELEYRCLSLDFIRRNSLSKLFWLEFRDELFGKHPFLRTALVKAEIDSLDVHGDRARVTLKSFGRSFVVELAREDFAQVWADGELVLDRTALFDQWTSLDTSNGETWLTGGAPLPASFDGHGATELRLGREWKIDDFLGEATDADPDADPDQDEPSAPTP